MLDPYYIFIDAIYRVTNALYCNENLHLLQSLTLPSTSVAMVFKHRCGEVVVLNLYYSYSFY